MAAHDQNPIGSGFHAKSTAAEVIKGRNLNGKTAIITGGYSGIGLETTRAFVSAGAKVSVPARRPDAAKQALAEIDADIEVAAMDLADLGSVRRFVDDFSATGAPLDFLINNAGIMANPETRIGPGWESQFGVNHLGHMALYQGLEPALLKAAEPRVVALSSTAHILSDIQWEDPHFKSHPYEKWTAYAQAKTANALFALEVDKRGRDKGLRAFSVHPGGILTPLQRHLPDEELVALGWKNPDGSIPERIQTMFKTPEQGASTTVWAATSPQLEGKGGVYCEDADIALLATEQSSRWEHVRAWACDDEKAARLWAMSEAMLSEA